MSVSVAAAKSASGDKKRPALVIDAPVVRILRDELLFRPGQRKTHLYLIEAGSVVLYQMRTGGTHEVIEFAFAGDIVGLGFLPEHIHCAQTLGETRVRCLPLNALGDLLANDAPALRRYDVAVRREFEFRRNQVIGLYWKPVSRLAAFFLALSQVNKYEGRDPCLISDAVKSGIVTDCVALDIDALGQALVELEKAGLIERYPPHGLRLTNLAALAHLANEAPAPASAEF
jgi:CRP/FNR family transcriptional regulator, anaerobic regulatory protein